PRGRCPSEADGLCLRLRRLAGDLPRLLVRTALREARRGLAPAWFAVGLQVPIQSVLGPACPVASIRPPPFTKDDQRAPKKLPLHCSAFGRRRASREWLHRRRQRPAGEP